MKKTICIILSAILISIFFVIGALADNVEINNGITYKSNNTVLLTSYSAITALNRVTFPIIPQGSTLCYTVFDMPSNYDSLSNVKFTINLSELSYKYCLYLDDQGGDTLVNIGQVSENYSNGVNTITANFSNVQSVVTKVIFVWTKGSGTAEYVHCVADLEFPNVWDGISAFITGIFGAIGSIITGIKGSGNNVILLFVIVIPLAAICIAYLFKFLGKKRRYRVRRKK